MKEIINILNNLRNKSGLDKLDYLSSVKDTPNLKEILFYASNPDLQFHIKEAKFNKIYDNFQDNRDKICKDVYATWSKYKTYLDEFASKKGVKDEEIEKLISVIFIWIDKELFELLKCVLFKDLKIGMDIKSFCKVWDDFYIKPQVMLAEDFRGELFEDCLISRKIDGRRGYFLNGKFYSRNNKEYKTINIQHIIEDLKKIENYGNLVFDGEFVYIYENDKEDFSKSGIVTRDKYTEDSKNIKFAIFYILNKNDFINKKESYYSFKEIYRDSTLTLCCDYDFQKNIENGLLKTTFNNLLLLKQFTKEHFDNLLNIAKENKWEGLMLLDASQTYQYKRTKYLQKIKEMKDAEFEVVGFSLGKNKYSNTLGNLTIKLDNSDTVDVGSGFTDSDRDLIWNKRDKILENNLYATIKYFEETKDSKTGKTSLRFPIFKNFYSKIKEEVVYIYEL